MSIQAELTRLTAAKAAIQAAIEGKGVTVPSGTLLDGMSELIQAIQAGGGNIASGTISWATIPSTIVKTEFVHNLGVAPKLFLICPAFDIRSTPTKNIGIHLISTESSGALSRYSLSAGSIRIYSDMSDFAMKSMQDFSSKKIGVYSDSTKLILMTYLDSVFTVNPGDIYNWIAVG